MKLSGCHTDPLPANEKAPWVAAVYTTHCRMNLISILLMNHVIGSVVMNFIILVAFSQQSPPVIPLAESVASDPDSALPASAQW